MAKTAKLDTKDKIIAAALALAAENGWDKTSLYDIADKAEVSLIDLFDHFDDRSDILAGLGKQIDRRVLDAVGEPDSTLSPRDRLFDLMMERFDVLNDYRDGIASILRSFRLDPKQALFSLPHLGKSMSWMLEAVGIETSGVKGCIKVAGLVALYLKTLHVWLDDDSPDMAKTMAALDKNLGRAEQWATTCRL